MSSTPATVPGRRAHVFATRLAALAAWFACAGGVASLAAPLAAQQPLPLTAEFPDDWFWHRTEEQRAWHRELLGKPMPALALADWHNGELDPRQDFAGKVVVVEFWATWCHSCLEAVPHNRALLEKHAGEDLVFVGVCGSPTGQERMLDVAKQHGIRHPIARDPTEASGKAFRVQWWPTYAVADRGGRLRAIGLKPECVDGVVTRLLAEPVPEFADLSAHREGREGGREEVDALEGKAAPALAVDGWLGTEPLRLDALRGKVVLVHFFATWSEPCRDSLLRVERLARQHADRGLVAISIADAHEAERMGELARQLGVKHPLARDVDGGTSAAWQVDGNPDFYFVDRRGVLRLADGANGSVEAVLDVLLAEPAPAPKRNGGAGEGEGDRERPK